MRITENQLRLYAITDDTWLNGRSLRDVVEEALCGGATCIQLREKETDEDTLVRHAEELHPLCRKYGIPLLINDNVQAAYRSHADGVHLGQGDMNPEDARKILGEDKIIGMTAHNLEEALKAEAAGADYLGIGAVFSTSTKKDTTPILKDEIRRICTTVHIPCVAIGGITKDNLKELDGLSIAGPAVVSAVFAAKDITAATRELRNLSESMNTEFRNPD